MGNYFSKKKEYSNDIIVYGNLIYFENIGIELDLPGSKCKCGLAINKCKYIINKKPICTMCFSEKYKDKILTFIK